MPDIIDNKSLNISKNSWKSLVKKAIRQKSEEDAKFQFLNSSKLNSNNLQQESFNVKDYVKNMLLTDTRTFFRYQSNMLPFKMNQKSDKKVLPRNS